LVAPLDELWEILKPSETMKRVALLDGE